MSERKTVGELSEREKDIQGARKIENERMRERENERMREREREDRWESVWEAPSDNG